MTGMPIDCWCKARGEMTVIPLTGFDLTLDQVASIARGQVSAALAPETTARIKAGRAIVDKAVADGKPVYGVTTGVGSQKTETVSADSIVEFNRKLLKAHSTHPPGRMMDRAAVRAALVVLINQLASGASGVRLDLIDLLISALKDDKIPDVTAEGSPSASDIIPLSQLANGILAAVDPPFQPGAKEGVAMMNSNAMSLGPGALLLEDMGRLLAIFDLTAAVTLEGFRGNPSILLDGPIKSLARAGRDKSAQCIRAFLEGSALWTEGQPRFLQDPLSFRCIPAIHGTSARAYRRVWHDWKRELNVTNDNPMMDLETGAAVSHGNMESGGETLDLDMLRLVLAKMAAISGERQHKLMWPSFSGLPSGLALEGAGPASGASFIGFSAISSAAIARMQITAQPVYLAMPGQLSDGVEDVSGFAMLAVEQTEKIVADAWTVVAMEISIAVWAVLRRDIPMEALGKGARAAVEQLAPHLPIGQEGEARFDARLLVDLVRAPGLLESAQDAAGLDPELQGML